MSFVSLLHVLQHSVDNDERQNAQAQLRVAQEQRPLDFLTFIFPVALGNGADAASSFFASTVLFEFVENSWRVVPDDGKTLYWNQLLTVLSTQLLSPAGVGSSRCRPHVRKLCMTLALMVKLQLPRKLARSASGEPVLPEVLAHTLHALAAGAAEPGLRCQNLIALHLLLKEMLSKRIGKTFESLCAAVSMHLNGWLTATAEDVSQREVFVWCLKIALRVYGHGVFSAVALRALLTTCFSLAGQVAAASTVLHNDSAQRQTVRALEYCCKIVVVAAENFAPRLSELGFDFFFSDEPTATSLFRFAYLSLQTCWDTRKQAADGMEQASDGADLPFSDKLACRCMRLLQHLTTYEDSDAFLASVLLAYSQSEQCVSMLQLVVERYLADDAKQQLARWNESPENLVADLDVVDDELSPASCAEQLFLAMTSSTSMAQNCATVAWKIVNELLQGQSDESVTAGLHAIGLGYANLAVYSNPAHYIAFLQSRLLPLIAGEIHCSSPLILRRVVWVIGMWCESVEELAQRQAIHRAFSRLIANPTATDPVVLLTTLRAVEHFVSDNHFSTSELDGLGSALDPVCNMVLPVYVSQLLGCLRFVIPALRTASMIKEIVGLCLALTEKQALSHGGEVMMFVLQPAVEHFMALSHKLQQQSSHEIDHDDEAGSSELATFGLILETIASAVKITSHADCMWSHLPLVVFCTHPDHVVSTWTQDYAWELLLRMVQSTPSEAVLNVDLRNKCLEGVHWAMKHLDRDFESIGVVLRCIAGFMILLGSQVPPSILGTLLSLTLQQLFVAEGAALQGYIALASVLLAQYPNDVAAALFSPLLRAHHAASDATVQEDERLPVLAVLLASVVLQKSKPIESFVTADDLALLHSPTEGSSQTLIEKWSLVLDVTPNQYASRVITLAALELVHRGFVRSDDDKAMVHAAVQSLVASESTASTPPLHHRGLQIGAYSPTGGCHHQHGDAGHTTVPREGSVDSTAANMGWDDGDGAEARSQLEMLLEWLGDGHLLATAPHVQRIAAVFGVPQ